jgi:hypothetical protein
MGSAIDYIEFQKESDNKTYKFDKFGFKIPVKAAEDSSLLKPANFGPDNSYIKLGTIEASKREEIIIPDEQNQAGIVIMDKFPLNVIKHFSLIETAPKELWANPKDGRINWMTRRSDLRNLKNNPISRQYFYMYPPERANILSYTNEWTTAGTVTHFTVSNPLAPVNNNPQTAEIYTESPTAYLTDPHTGLPLRNITRNRFIYDDTLVAGNDQGAEQVAAAMFNIWGKSIQAGMVTVAGDPSLEVGEAVQLFNTGLLGRRYHPAVPKTLDNTYDATESAYIEGTYRVEGLTHLFAIGGVGQGYKTVFIFGELDPPTGSINRQILNDNELTDVEKIDNTKYLNNLNPNTLPTAPILG